MKHLVWIDLETTGLNPAQGRILEYHMLVTNMDLVIEHELGNIIRQNIDNAIAYMYNKIIQMHTDNGLIEDIRLNSLKCNYEDSIKEEETKILNILYQYKDTEFILAGSTPHFDREWIKHELPRLHSLLHYRHVDVSVYKTMWPLLFAKSESSHRAKGDIYASLEMQKIMNSKVIYLHRETNG